MIKKLGLLAGMAALALLIAAAPASAQAIGGNASLTAGAASSQVALPASPQAFPSIIIAPVPGSAETFYKLGTTSAVAATTTSSALPSGGICINVGPNTNLAAITASGAATLRITQLNTCAGFSASGAGSPSSPGVVTVVPFAPAGLYATLTATGSSASVALPAGTAIVVSNAGTTAVSCKLSVGTGAATANEDIIQPSSSVGYSVGANTFENCIDQTGSASNLVVISGGSGSFVGAGGGAGGSSGGTVNQGTQGSSASPWWIDTAPSGSNLLAAVESPLAVQSATGKDIGQIENSFAGVAASVGNGQTGTGAQRVTLSQDSLSAPINISTATTTQLVALSGSLAIYVTSFDVIAGGTGNITFEYGTGTACASGTTVLTGAYPLIAQAGIAKGNGGGTLLKVPSGNALCALTSAGVQMSGSVSYLQF